MISINDLFNKEQECCGCGACASICPQDVIYMREDQLGFLYPNIKDATKCIDCNQCLLVCPEKNYYKIDSSFSNYYAGYYDDYNELVSCASGGLATAISKRFIKNGGIVYGVSYSNDWKSVIYKRAETTSEVNAFKTSKYAQSEKGTVYKDILNDLKHEKNVLFIGLPCDVLAVKNRIPYSLQNTLYLLELICHGPTSIKVHRQYINTIEKGFNDGINYFSTREKKDGNWKPFYICARSHSGEKMYEEFHKSAYGDAFRYLKRPSCYACKIKGKHLPGDLMIGDYHYVEEGMKGYNMHGVSSALVHNNKGAFLLKEIQKEGFSLFEINKRGAVGNGAINHAIPKPNRQIDFENAFIDYGLMGASKLNFVRIANIKRSLKEKYMKFGVKIKRIVIPASKPLE